MSNKVTKPPAKTGGRPTKCTPEFTENLCRMIVKIGYPGIAAETLGVHRVSVYRWMAADEEFAAAVNQAKAQYIARELPKSKNIEWKLERLDPETFGRRDPASTVVNVTQTTQTISREDALRELRELAASDPEITNLLSSITDSV